MVFGTFYLAIFHRILTFYLTTLTLTLTQEYLTFQSFFFSELLLTSHNSVGFFYLELRNFELSAL